MKRPLWIGALVMALFLAGLFSTLGGGARPRDARSVRHAPAAPIADPPAAPASSASPAHAPRSVSTQTPAVPAPVAGPASSPARAPGAKPDPSGAETRRLVRSVVELRRQRDWGRLAALQKNIDALTVRDLHILLHLLKTEAAVEDQLAIGDILARHADDPERAGVIAHYAGTLARVFRRIAERGSDGGPGGDEVRVRAVEHLARFAREEDAPFVIDLFRDPARARLAQAASLAVARTGAADTWSARLRDAATSAGNSLETAWLAIALDGVGRRTGDATAREWVRTALGPRLATLAAGADRPVALEALSALALVHETPAAETLAATFAAERDPAARRRLLDLVPEVASDEDVEMLRQRLAVPPDDPLAAHVAGVLDELAARGPGR